MCGIGFLVDRKKKFKKLEIYCSQPNGKKISLRFLAFFEVPFRRTPTDYI